MKLISPLSSREKTFLKQATSVVIILVGVTGLSFLAWVFFPLKEPVTQPTFIVGVPTVLENHSSVPATEQAMLAATQLISVPVGSPMPELIGRHKEEALSKLNMIQVTVVISSEHNMKCHADDVVATTPGANNPISRASVVTLVVCMPISQ